MYCYVITGCFLEDFVHKVRSKCSSGVFYNSWISAVADLPAGQVAWNLGPQFLESKFGTKNVNILRLKVRREIHDRPDNLLHAQIDEEITNWRNVPKKVVAVVKRLRPRG